MSEISHAPIILIHGWGMNKHVWQTLIEGLPSAIANRITCLDLPGYGANQTLLAEYSIEALAEWLNEQVPEPSHIIGWSLGGLVAQQFALDFGDKTLSLGLVASTPKFIEHESWAGIKPNILKGFKAQLVIDHASTVKQFLKIQAMGSPTLKSDLKRIQQAVFSQPEPTDHALQSGLALLEQVDLRQRWGDISVPIHLCLGKNDALVPVNILPELLNMNDQVDAVVMAKSSHAPFISEPGEFSNWLLERYELSH